MCKTDDTNNTAPAAAIDEPHPEQPFSSHGYLNLYHGVTIDKECIFHYTQMTDEQRRIHEAFVTRVQESSWSVVQPDEMTCLRFLQADKYNADKAFQRLQTNQEWLLNTANLVQVLQNKPAKLEVYRKLRARAYMGRTESGTPIFVERLGEFMSAVVSKQGKSLCDQDYLDCFLYDIAELLAKIQQSYQYCTERNLPVTWTATWIMDCKNMSLYKAMKAMHTLKLLDSITEPNFPEIAGNIYMINAPTIVSAIWKVAKTFLDPSIIEKIQIHSNVPKELLLKGMGIDESALFEEFGGTSQATYPKAEYA